MVLAIDIIPGWHRHKGLAAQAQMTRGNDEMTKAANDKGRIRPAFSGLVRVASGFVFVSYVIGFTEVSLCFWDFRPGFFVGFFGSNPVLTQRREDAKAQRSGTEC
jgi:hypothetical protein